MSYDLRIGEQVSFLHEQGGGKVMEFQANGMVLVLTEDGFETPYPASSLVPRFDLREEKPVKVEEKKGPLQELDGFKLGQRVHMLNENDSAIILKLFEDKRAEIEFEDLFTRRVPLSELLSSDALKEKQIIASLDEVTLSDIGEENTYRNPQQSLKDRKDSGVWEVDLHIQELVDNSYGMLNHEIVQLQLDHFQGKLDEAIDKGLKKIIFIHGRGEGRLRNAIREVLKRYTNCEYLDADYKRYGVGATEVRIKYRPLEEQP